MVPQAGRLDVDLGLVEVDGDELFQFNPTTASYVTYVGDSINLPAAPWDSPAGYPANPTVAVGGGFFYYTVNAGGNPWVRTFTVN
jgi:hypothetical protein